MPAPCRATDDEPQASQRRGAALAVAAVVAGDRPLGAMEDQRDVAVRALPRPPARPARQEVRPPPAVEQHDRLVARPGAPPRAPGGRAGAARPGRRACPAPRPGAADGRRTRASRRRRAQRAHALRTRRRRAAQQDGAGALGAALGHPPRVVARVALMLVGGVVLLVDDHEAEVGHRREHGRARPDADARLARGAGAATRHGARRRPVPECSTATVVAEARLEARDDLRGQRDLRHEHDGPAAALQRRGRGAQVDLGLARAGDALQEEALGAPRLDRRGHRRERLRLGGRERRCSGGRGADPRVMRAPPARAAYERHEPAGLQPSERAVAGIQLRRGRLAARRSCSSASRWREPSARPFLERRLPGRRQVRHEDSALADPPSRARGEQRARGRGRESSSTRRPATRPAAPAQAAPRARGPRAGRPGGRARSRSSRRGP